MAGSSSSSSLLSSSDDRREFDQLVREADEARQRYSDATHEMGRLELYPDAVGETLFALKRETATA